MVNKRRRKEQKQKTRTKKKRIERLNRKKMDKAIAKLEKEVQDLMNSIDFEEEESYNGALFPDGLPEN